MGRPANKTCIVPEEEILSESEVQTECWVFASLLLALRTEYDCLEFLAKRGLVRNRRDCHRINCSAQLTLHFRRDIHAAASDRTDGMMWRCPACHKSASARRDSFFSGSNLSLVRMILYIYLWSNKCTAGYIQTELRMSPDTLANWSKILGEVCSDLQNTDYRFGKALNLIRRRANPLGEEAGTNAEVNPEL